MRRWKASLPRLRRCVLFAFVTSQLHIKHGLRVSVSSSGLWAMQKRMSAVDAVSILRVSGLMSKTRLHWCSCPAAPKFSRCVLHVKDRYKRNSVTFGMVGKAWLNGYKPDSSYLPNWTVFSSDHVPRRFLQMLHRHIDIQGRRYIFQIFVT